MNKVIYKYLTALLVLFVSIFMLNSCKQPSELVPLNENQSYINASYKLPEPKLIDDADKAEVEAIKEEYNTSTSKSE